jgi:hypothetical protein
MKRFHLLMLGLVLCTSVAVGYSDSHEIKRDTIQVDQDSYIFATLQAVDYSAELPMAMTVEHPDLGRPASNYIMVSEELTDVFEMRIRPPPEKVQKSEYKILK